MKALGRVKIGAGIRFDGLTGWCMLLVIAMLRLYWYIMLGVLWMMYGFIYLCFVLPIRGIVRLCKKRKNQ